MTRSTRHRFWKIGAIVFIALLGPSLAAHADRDCTITTVGLTPLIELGSERYLDYQGGLYPGGANQPPTEHLSLGLDAAEQVVPRDAAGLPSTDGLVGLLAVGVSNTRTEFNAFRRLADDEAAVSPHLVLLNGAQGSRALEEWDDGGIGLVWDSVDDAVIDAGLSPAQVQAAWVKLPSASRGTVDLAAADAEIASLTAVVRSLKARFANLRLAYVSSRIYGGYAMADPAGRRAGGPEPKAYQHGFTTKWLIEHQIYGSSELNPDPALGTVVAPWLGWGPYLWADGLTPRHDGLTWECADLDEDGIHPSPGGADKVARLLFEHFSEDPTSSSWFLSGGGETTAPPNATIPAATSLRPSPSVVEATAPATPTPANSDWPWAIGLGAGLLLVGAAVTASRRR